MARQADASIAPPPLPSVGINTPQSTRQRFGIKDPYSWLEKNWGAWLPSQVDYANRLLEPSRDVFNRLKSRWDSISPAVVASTVNETVTVAGHTYYLNDEKLMRKSADGTERIFFDPRTKLPPDDAKSADAKIMRFRPSSTGDFVAVVTSRAGRQWEVHFLNKDGELTSDVLRHVFWTDITWMPDGRSVIYSQSPIEDDSSTIVARGLGIKLHHYALGSDASTVVFDPNLGEYAVEMQAHRSEGHLVIRTQGVNETVGVFTKPLISALDTSAPWTQVCRLEDDVIDIAVAPPSMQGKPVSDLLFVAQWKDANDGRVVAYDLNKPGSAPKTVFEPPREEIGNRSTIPADIYQPLIATAHGLYVHCKGLTEDTLWHLPWTSDGIGEAIPVTLPQEGAIDSIAESEVGLTFIVRPLIGPATHYEFNASANNVKDTRLIAPPSTELINELYSGLKKSVFEVPGPNGSTILWTLLHSQDFDPFSPKGKRPVLVKAYHSYGYWTAQGLSSEVNTFTEQELMLAQTEGVVLAVPHIRGGGENGRTGYWEGQGGKRQQSFDDLNAAVEGLIRAGITSGPKVCLSLFSSGAGLLSAVLQRPELYGSVIAASGTFDYLMISELEGASNFAFNREEYGNPYIPEELRWLLAMSPFHRALEFNRQLPHPLQVIIVTDTDDEKTTSGGARKMGAALQEHVTPHALLWTLAGKGHGGVTDGSNSDERLRALAYALVL